MEGEEDMGERKGDGGRRRRVEVGDKGGMGWIYFTFFIVYFLQRLCIYHSKYTMATANLLTIILHRRR